jgi:hypothetical protein
VSDGGFALGVKFEKFVGHIFHGLADTGFRFRPGLGAEMAEHRLCAFGRAVFLHQIEAGERDVEARGIGEFQQHEFSGAVAVVDFL